MLAYLLPLVKRRGVNAAILIRLCRKSLREVSRGKQLPRAFSGDCGI